MLFGSDFRYSVKDDIGRAIHTFGLYDLCVSEALWLLLKPGDVVCDVGANMGYFSTVLSQKVGHAGVVHAFEPNPEIIPQLLKNTSERKNIIIHKVGLSDSEGLMSLYAPRSYDGNKGLASLHDTTGEKIANVELITLDELGLNPAVVKLDIEGHELQALKGAEKTLAHVEHIVFEDHNLEKNGVKSFLKEKGFNVYYLEKNFSFLRLKSTDLDYSVHLSEPPNYLATKWGIDDLNKVFLQSKWVFIEALKGYK